MAFQKATKRRAKLRLAIIGPSGSGKTYTGLTLAKHLGTKVAVIDTERGSASKYADKFAFDVTELESFAPATYIAAINEAATAGYDVLVIDSLSHAWMGKGGALEMVDTAAKRSQSNNAFAAWRDVTPQHNAMVEAIITAPLHVIVTMRAKTEYVMEQDSKGKTVPRKIGIAPIQRDGLEYEFDVVGDMDYENNFIVSKSRCEQLTGAVIAKPNGNLADVLKAWLNDGSEPVELKKVGTVAQAPVTQVTPTPAPSNGNGHTPAPATEVPTCPICNGPMWDNRQKLASGGKGPEWSCKAGKWNAETKQKEGCQGQYWPGQWPPKDKPTPEQIATIKELVLQNCPTPDAKKEWRAWLALNFAVDLSKVKGVVEAIEKLTTEQADSVIKTMQAEAKEAPEPVPADIPW